jgi:rod shape-determining protein MreC
VYQQSVRRRRAVLAALVVSSLILLTAYFGESAGGGLHSVQRGVLDVVSPIQEGASRALKPFRDLAGWFGSTLNAKGDRDKYKKERDTYRREAIQYQSDARRVNELQSLVDLDKSSELSAYGEKTARVIARSPTIWYATININKGSNDGVRVNQPVVSGAGLVGKVTEVTGDAARVTLITDHTSGVSAEIASSGDAGLVSPAVGDPEDLLLDFLPPRAKVFRGQPVVTSGSKSSRLESLFPPGIPIGSVTHVDSDEVKLYQRVHITPYADLRKLDFVQVLTPPKGGSATGDSSLKAQAP